MGALYLYIFANIFALSGAAQRAGNNLKPSARNSRGETRFSGVVAGVAGAAVATGCVGAGEIWEKGRSAVI